MNKARGSTMVIMTTLVAAAGLAFFIAATGSNIGMESQLLHSNSSNRITKFIGYKKLQCRRQPLWLIPETFLMQ